MLSRRAANSLGQVVDGYRNWPLPRTKRLSTETTKERERDWGEEGAKVTDDK